jgi:epoxyqueuosine reductase
MLEKQELIDEALRIGFDDIGFTSVEPFEEQKRILLESKEQYAWTYSKGLDLMQGTHPQEVFSEAKSIIVLIYNYFQEAFPPSMVGRFGRCYMNDDRVIKDNLYKKIKEFRGYLLNNGIQFKLDANIPQRLAAARAGLGTFGKNNFFYSNKVALQSSWVTIIAGLVDYEFTPDKPTVEVACPSWCKNACMAACPTGAFLGPNRIDPRKCIAYLSYFSEETPVLEYREAMGMRVYGCDRCQEVCPRNQPWLAQELPLNTKVAAWADKFDLASSP